jgi:hypothetical protein
MIIENKYVVVINDLGDCIIHNYFNAVKIETNSKIITVNELSELDINLLPILEDIKDIEVNKIYNIDGIAICDVKIIPEIIESIIKTK